MNLTVEQYAELKSNVDRLQSKYDKAQGVYEQLMSDLAKEFGVTTLKQAKSKLQRMRDDLEAEETQFSKTIEEFEEQWGEKLLPTSSTSGDE